MILARLIDWLRERLDRSRHKRARDQHLWTIYEGQRVCAYCDCEMTRRNRRERCRSNAFFRVYLGGRPQ